MTDWGHDHVECQHPIHALYADREKRHGFRRVRIPELDVTAADLFRMSEDTDFTDGLTVEQYMDWLRHRDRANDYAKEPE